MKSNYPTRLLLCLCVWLLAGLWTPAAHATVLKAGSEPVDLSATVEFLEDLEGSLDVQALERPEVAARFQPLGQAHSFGFTASTYWLRLRLSAATPQQQTQAQRWVIELASAQVEELDFHAPGAAPVRTGSKRSLDSRPRFHRFFAFPVELGQQEQVLYLRARSAWSLNLPLQAWTEAGFLRHQQQVVMLQFVYQGALLALLAYNLMLWLALRDARFLLYSLYLLCFGLGMLAGNGYGRLLLWTDAPGFDTVAQSVLLGLSAALAVQFSRAFLDTGRWLPRLDRALRLGPPAFLGLSLALLLTLALSVPAQPLNQALVLGSVVILSLIQYAGYRVLRSGVRGARFFVLGWGILFLGGLVAALHGFALLPSNTLTAYALQISSVFELLALALALTDIVRQERHERERSQQLALEAQRNLVETLKSSEEGLERAVRERTAQLDTLLARQGELLAQHGRFARMISHEVRNPLAIVESQLSVLRKEHERGVDQVDKRVTVIGSATRRLRNLFEKWLQREQVESRLSSLAPAWIALPAWLEQVVDAHAYHMLEHPVEWKLDPGIAGVWADADSLEIALGNLLENACKYSEPGSTITIETCKQPGWTGIAVVDRGRGIAPEQHEAVFKEFYRAAPESSIAGMGLGLAVVRRIVQAQGGRVELQSETGRGSRFCLWLPAHQHGTDNGASR